MILNKIKTLQAPEIEELEDSDLITVVGGVTADDDVQIKVSNAGSTSLNYSVHAIKDTGLLTIDEAVSINTPVGLEAGVGQNSHSVSL